MEQNLQLLGATAIKHSLQDGILETIQCPKQGNIKVWILTENKPETAMTIGFAYQLLSEDMFFLQEEIVQILEALLESNNNLVNGKGSLKNWFLPQVKMVVVINGGFPDLVLLSLRKEPWVTVQNVNVDLEESWQEPGEQRTDFLQTRHISACGRPLGSSWSTVLVPQNKDPKSTRSLRCGRSGPP